MNKIFYIALTLVVILNSSTSYSQWGDCANSIEACTNPSFSVTPNSFGLVEEFTPGTISNPSSNPNSIPGNSGCLLAGELNSTWLLITVTSPGSLEFSMGSLSTPGCFDWIMWPYTTTTCNDILSNTLPPVACNWNGACSGLTGMAAPGNLPAGASQPDFENGLTVNTGDQFMICLSNYGGANTNIPLNFYGTAGTTCGGTVGTTICEGDTATIYAIDGVSYAWETATFGFITTNTAGDTAFVNPTITTSYPVLITFSDGTTAMDTAIVTVNPSINATSTVVEDICFGNNSASITVNTPGGTAPFSFSLSGPVSGNNTNGIFTNLPDGTYTIDIIDNAGCSDQISITVNPGPLCGETVNATICEGDTAIISALNGISYVWNTSIPGFNTTNTTGDSAYVNPTITTSYPVFITLSDGTVYNDTAIVTVNPAINATSTVVEDICLGDITASITINTPGGTAPFTFNLTGPISSNNTIGLFSSLPDGTYTINITDNAGCSDQISVIVNPGPFCCDIVISTRGDTVNCTEDCSGIVIVDTTTAHPPVAFQWFDEFNNPIVGATNDTLFSQCEGTYYVEVTDVVCMKRDTNFVSVNLSLPTPLSSNDTTINVDQDIQLWSSGGESYLWAPFTYLNCISCDTVISTPGEDITYYIQVTDSLGCQNEDTVNVIVLYNPLFIPNGFSPNNDNQNDILYVRGGGVASFQMQIFDKWGNLVFESIDITIGWDGTYKSKPVNTGVYVYRMDAKLKNGESLLLTGNITLFR